MFSSIIEFDIRLIYAHTCHYLVFPTIETYNVLITHFKVENQEGPNSQIVPSFCHFQNGKSDFYYSKDYNLKSSYNCLGFTMKH